MGGWQPALALLAPGYTVAYIGPDPSVPADIAGRVGRSGLVLWCDARLADSAAMPAANRAFVRCAPASLPILSHALDVLLLDLDDVEEGALTEARRVLAPGGVAFLRYDAALSEWVAQLRSALASLGFREGPELGFGLLVECAPK